MTNAIAMLRSVCSITFLLLLSGISYAQVTVRGKILNPEGSPLPGATVQVKGTEAKTVSGNDGSFEITAPSAQSVLIISYVGYDDLQLPIGNRTDVVASMKLSSGSLSDVVVVGYGTQKKSDVTGALTSISAKTIQERPVQNVLQAVQGKAAGVNVSSNIKPGELPSVRIRGSRSTNASNEPLYVIDGIPVINIPTLNVTSFSISDLNPNDIASIEILKDASATAIYGSRGANGVILITTKKGTKGRIAVNYNSNVSLDRYKRLTDWMTAGEYIDRWREALINGRAYQTTTNTNLNNPATIGYPDPFLDRDKMGLASDQRALQSVWMGYEWEVFGQTPKMRATTTAEQAMGWPAMVPVYNANNVRSHDWLDEVVRTGINQNHQISLSSGTDVSRLYLSLGYNKQLGVQRDQDYQRFNINLNGDITANNWLTLGTSLLAALSEQSFGISTNSSNTGSKDLFSRATDQLPYAQPRDENGFFIRNAGGNLNLWNPIIDIDQSVNDRRATSLMANIFTEVKFTSWLKYRVNFGAQLRNFRNGAWTGPNATGHLGARPNTAGYSRDENFSWVAENLLYADKTFNQIHTIGATLLQSSQKSRREVINTNVSGTSIPLSLWYDLAANTVGRPDGYGSGYTENSLMSYMARVNYNLMNKYLLTVSGRYDGASVLAPGNKWSFFPSFALAWKMHEEKFLRNVRWIDELKPRVGYGVTGSSSVQPYTTTGPLSRNPYIFGALTALGYLPQLVQNPDLGWEKTAQLNLGLDFSVINRRISGSIEVYEAQTSDLILSRSIPGVSGYVQIFQNVGKTRNRGIEITLSTINVQTRDFSWSMDLNYSTNKEEYVELLNGKEDILAERRFIGHPLEVFFHYQHDGVWQNNPKDMAEIAKFNANGHRFYPGMIKVVDQLTVDTNGDGIPDAGDYRINGSDYVIRGSTRPKWIGGLTNTFRYKNFTLSSFAYARIGQTYFGGYPGVFGRMEKDTWSWTNTGGRWPLPILGAQVDNFTPAMQFNDGSFVVVRNISLMYDMPTRLLSRAKIKNLQLNVQVLNPFIFGGEVVKWGLNPDDETNWSQVSQPNSNSTSPLGGTNNNTILPQSLVFGLRLGL